jgi:hypothetical protein
MDLEGKYVGTYELLDSKPYGPEHWAKHDENDFWVI